MRFHKSDMKIMKFSQSFTMKSLLVLILIILIYHSTFVWLSERFAAPDSYYSHGFLVPFIVAFLIWRKRDIFMVTTFDSARMGLVLLLLGLFSQIVSVVVEVYLISEFSLLLVIFGLTFYLFGKKIGKELLLPLSFLIFMIPIPMFLINHITFPMRMMVTKSTVTILSILSLPIAH